MTTQITGNPRERNLIYQIGRFVVLNLRILMLTNHH